MKRAHIPPAIDRKWLMPVLLSSVFSLALLLFVTLGRLSTSPTSDSSHQPETTVLDRDLGASGDRLGLPTLPRLAYLISGSKGDAQHVRRVLQAAYHPRNYYLLHLDSEASDTERLELAKFVKSDAVLREFKNVMVVGKANLVTYKGPTMVACTLHAIAILLKQAKNWDWFVNLSASDYPLMSQDDILHIFSYLPRDLNFLEHTSSIGWKEFHRARPVIIDPGLYHSKKSGVFWAKEKRSMPSSFKLFMEKEKKKRGEIKVKPLKVHLPPNKIIVTAFVKEKLSLKLHRPLVQPMPKKPHHLCFSIAKLSIIVDCEPLPVGDKDDPNRIDIRWCSAIVTMDA